jgi:molybdate transport system regulatory protein
MSITRPARERPAAAWEARPRWRIVRSGTIALGPGKADLLDAIAGTGSISAAAKRIGMSYRRAWVLVSIMNTSFRSPLVETFARRRIGASLTPEGSRALRLYRRIESRSRTATSADAAALLRLLAPPKGRRR